MSNNVGIPGIHIDPKELDADQLRSFISDTIEKLSKRLAEVRKAVGGNKTITAEGEEQAANILEDIARLASLLAFNLSDRQRDGAKITATLCMVMTNLIMLTQEREKHLEPMVAGPKIYLPEGLA